MATKNIDLEKNKAVTTKKPKVNKVKKPDNPFQDISVLIDDTLTQSNFGAGIVNILDKNEVKFSIESQIFSNCIIWKRITKEVNLPENYLNKNETNIEHVLFLLDFTELLNIINTTDLVVHFRNITEILNCNNVTIAITGLDGYFKFVENNKFQNVKKYLNAPKITRDTVERKLAELQIFTGCCARYLNSDADAENIVFEFTKAVAKKPDRLEKHEKLMLTENYAEGDKKFSVKVDKFGNGLQRLWQQNLTAFPMATLETAEAVMESYPTFKSIIKGCTATSVEKTGGALSFTRKIGPEFNRKLTEYYNSLDGDKIL